MTAVSDASKEAITHQYRSALKMLGQAIESCPEPLWLAGSPNRFWHIAYHALFYTHFYLAPTEAAFVPWTHHRPEYNFFGAVPWRPNEVHIADIPYTKPELKDYLDLCLGEVERQTALLDPEASSGFFWLPFNKLELQFYNLRHIAHHTGQLSDRLRSHADLGVSWVL